LGQRTKEKAIQDWERLRALSEKGGLMRSSKKEEKKETDASELIFPK